MRPRFVLLLGLGALSCKAHSLGSPAVAAAATAPAETEPLVRIDTGAIRGRSTGTSSAAFRGVPYAAPPTGDRRWRPPERAGEWPGVLDATGFGYACVQSPSSHQPEGTPLGSEDCLTLNVFAPDLRPAHPLPVLVFIHGGFFAWGSSSVRVDGADIYDGTSLAARMDAVVVTLNYRLGPLGFLYGNFGLQDQMAALGWVRRNIAAFGGDPERVTLSGHSAGAISTLALVASPKARGLFARAILFSGAGNAKPRAQVEVLEEQLARRVGCAGSADALGCMRRRSAPEIVAALPEAFGGGRGYAPMIDGDILPASPVVLLSAGQSTPVPLMLGTTSNEYSTMMHTVIQKPVETDAELEAIITHGRGSSAGARMVLERYPLESYPSRTALLTTLWSDAAFVCPTRAVARAAASLEPGKVWRFVFSHTYEAPKLHALGAGHGLELPLLFRNLWPDFILNDEESALGDAFTNAVARFVRDGDPASETFQWVPYVGATDTYLDLDTKVAARSGLRTAECDFWDWVWRKK